MKDFDKNKESSYMQYFDANNLYGWAMSQSLPVSSFKQIEKDDLLKFNEKLIKNYDDNSDKEYIFEVTIICPEKLHGKHKDLAFSPDKEKVNKCQKLICSIYDKVQYVVHIKTLKQTIKYGLELVKVYRDIGFRQKHS